MINLYPRIKSRLIPNTLEFTPYNKQETEGILKERLQYAFVSNTLDKEAFDLIVEKTFELKDIRSGLFLIKEAGEIAESKSLKKISLDNSKEAILKLQDFKKKNLDSFEDIDKGLIEIIKCNPGKSATEIFQIYEAKEVKSYRTFQRKIKSLEKADVIFLKGLNKGFETGRSTIIEYNADKTLNEF